MLSLRLRLRCLAFGRAVELLQRQTLLSLGLQALLTETAQRAKVWLLLLVLAVIVTKMI